MTPTTTRVTPQVGGTEKVAVKHLPSRRLVQVLLLPVLSLALLVAGFAVDGDATTTRGVSGVFTKGLDIAGVAAEAASAATGNVDFSGYCRSHYGGSGISVSATHAWTGSWTLVTWRCTTTALYQMLSNPARLGPPLPGGRCLGCRVVTQTRQYEIDVNAVCRWQFGSGASAFYVGESWSDWRCRY